jgi:hypothetical protein
MNKNVVFGSLFALLLIGGGTYFVLDTSDNTATTTNQIPATSGENPQPGSSVHDLPVEPAAAAARKDLALRLSVGEKSIVILQITETTWNDGCLGLGGIAESCLQALVPGFRVEMLAEGKTYVYRTDKTGASVRAETQ